MQVELLNLQSHVLALFLFVIILNTLIFMSFVLLGIHVFADKLSTELQVSLHLSTIPGKIFGTKWSNPVKLDRKRKVWYVFLHAF